MTAASRWRLLEVLRVKQMKYRSWLIVPGNNDRLLAGCADLGADVVVVDLDATVPVEHKRMARDKAAQWLAAHRASLVEGRRLGRWVRINPMSTSMWRDDILAIMPGAPDGIVLPRADGPEAVRQLAAELYEIEARCGVPANSTRIIPVAGETPQSALRIPDYLVSGHPRIAGLTWGAQELAATISGTSSPDAGHESSDIFRFVRAQTLLGAHAAGIMAIDAFHAGFLDRDALAKAALASRSDGFAGMMAIHPDQIETINQAFTPSPAELEEARAIIDAFGMNPGVGTISFKGCIIDRSRLRLARRILGLSADAAPHSTSREAPILRPA